MRLLKKMISAFLVVCMIISMAPMTALATETDSTPSVEGRIVIDQPIGQTSVWIDGVEYAVQSSGGSNYVDLPAGTEPGSMVTYSYHVGGTEDVHTQYPVGMQVWALNKNEDGSYTPEKVEELTNILQYSGSSIRVTGKKGIRMITSIEQNKKNDLVSGGLAGYKLLEYGTVLAWSDDLEGGNPLVLGRDYVKSNYAYKKGVADPVFAYSGNLMQYTNVLVDFTMDECKDDVAMRSYMILENENGEQMTIYGGIVHRSIGYIAWQNREVFTPGSAAYEYVWEIINYVYAQVSFETNGGSAVESAFVQKGNTLEKPADPEKEGVSFGGWYKDEALTEAFDFTSAISEDLTLYAKWNASSALPMPENPSDADEYYWGTSEVLEVIDAEKSENVLTEAEIKVSLEGRGFTQHPVTYNCSIQGEYLGDIEVVENSPKTHPVYQTYYVSSSGEVWSIYVINDGIMAYPVSYMLESVPSIEILVSESNEVTGYDPETNKFYINIPFESTSRIIVVNRIDAETLDKLTIGEIDKS